MEGGAVGANSNVSAEGDNLTTDLDLYSVDSYDTPDPGLLLENDELYFRETPQVQQLFTSSQRWKDMTLHTRARHLWLLLRAGLHNLVEKVKTAEMRAARLTHGLELLRRLEVAAGLHSVAQDPVGGRFVVLDGAGYLHLHRKDGWAQQKLQAPVALTGLVVVPGPLGAMGRFVGWGPAGLAILGPSLSLLWLSQLGMGRAQSHEPTCCLPVPRLGLLLVAEFSGSLTLWKFRAGGRRLVQCGSIIQPPPGMEGTLKRLALGPASAHLGPRCFAAYGSSVLTLDLRTWALIHVCRDLHKTTISDLAYCKEVEAMVTASRDSTVKVWEMDWQIRMVFVGHTGPVTAMTLLPKTTLVVSASQDGTLRTWDLQAEAQVGEAALAYRSQDKLSWHVNQLLAPAGTGWPVLCLCARSVELWKVRELYSMLVQLPAQVLHLEVAPTLPIPVDPVLPIRLICACADGSVLLVSAASGHVVNTLLLDREDCAAAVAYCLPREALWLLTRTGNLVRVNAARCPMSVLHRISPPSPSASKFCCLHLYSHLTDPSTALACWEIVCQHGGDPCRCAMAWAWKNKNRYLPVVGHTDGMLSVLDWLSSKTVFHIKAHTPGPVTAIASTRNSIVSSGGDKTVKVWRVFPYAEESLSLLHTFSCCHPVVRLCTLGNRITVGFEDPDRATYGVVQFGLYEGQRWDHRPQDDPTDHITGLCCCPTLKLYACASLDCTIRIWTAENRLLRLLQLDGAPQALVFCSNSADMVLALGSRLCLVSHRIYLPTFYLVQKLHQKAPDVVDGPPLPLTNQESLTPMQLQRLTNLQGMASLSVNLPFIHHQMATPQQPVVKEDLEALETRDQDLQQLKLGLIVPAAQPPLSSKQHQEAFENYLYLIYGPSLLDLQSGVDSQQWSTLAITTKKEFQDENALPSTASFFSQAVVNTKSQKTPTSLSLHALKTPSRSSARPPQVSLPIPPIRRKVHSRASQLLARSSLSHDLGLSLDLLLHSKQIQGEITMALESPTSLLQHRVPLLLKRKPKEPLSNLTGFFPAAIHPHKYCTRPISFPGFVPNSVVLQQMWLPMEVSCLGSLVLLTSQSRLKLGINMDDLWLSEHRWSTDKWRKRFLQWLHRDSSEEEEEEEEEEEDKEFLELEWDSLSPEKLPSKQQLDSWEPKAQDSTNLTTEPWSSYEASGTSIYYGYSIWEEHYGNLPRFLHYFVAQNWFKNLFPNFSLEAYPEMGTVEGLASVFMDQLAEATWADRVHILHALLRLMPSVSQELQNRLQGSLLQLLNLDKPPSLEDLTQKQFVMLALQLLLACSLDSRDVVVELMSYYLYSPATFRPEIKKLLGALGLQDPQGFLFKEMMTWVPSSYLDSKAMVRACCCQKLEDMTQQLKMETTQMTTAKMGAVMPKVSETSVPMSTSKETLSQASMIWGTSMSILELQQKIASLELQAKRRPVQIHTKRTRRLLSDTLQKFYIVPQARMDHLVPPTQRDELLPLEKTDWSRSKMLDLCIIDALNYFCEKERIRQSLLQEVDHIPLALRLAEPNTVVLPPRNRGYHPILRLQEAMAQSSGMRLRGHLLSRNCARTLDGTIHSLKLPLPRVEPRPFPPDWPKPTRAQPPRLLQPALQRYFLLEDTDPNNYN